MGRRLHYSLLLLAVLLTTVPGSTLAQAKSEPTTQTSILEGGVQESSSETATETTTEASNWQPTDEITEPGSGYEPEDSPQGAITGKIDYSRWSVFKVNGPSRGVVLSGLGTEKADVAERVEVLEELEETSGVRVLHDNQLQNYFQIAVSPESRVEVMLKLAERGFSLDDTNVDLGKLIEDEEAKRAFRLAPLKGEVTFDSYMTYEQIESFITEFANRHADVVKRSVIGQSVEGRDIHMLTLTNGPRATLSGARRNRQSSAFPTNSSPSIDETLKALAGIISWSDSKTADSSVQDRKEEELDQRKNDPKRADPVILNESRTTEGSNIHEFLDHMVHNMPYALINGEMPAEGAIENTYSTLKKIMNVSPARSDDFSFNNFPNEPREIHIAYKVLQKIINSDPNHPKNIGIEGGEDGTVIGSTNRIAKTLHFRSANRTSSDPNQIDREAEILLIVTSILPSEYTRNKTIVDSVTESVRIILENLPRGSNLTDEIVKQIAPKIVQIPGVVGVASDSRQTRPDLITKLERILLAKNSSQDTDTPNQSSKNNQMESDIPILKASTKKPVIFIDGGIHAREWISPAFLMYALTQLVESPDLLEGIEWRLVPVLNPDGYIYTWKSDRMWRKNRSKANRYCYGVDLNRNFGYKHGGSGSSSNPCSEIYRGPSAFSEPESQALKKAVESVKDRLKAYVTVHSYGQMILHPWGYTSIRHPDTETMNYMGQGMAEAIRAVNGKHYSVGSAAGILYPSAGGSDDWASSEGVLYSYTVELRDTGSTGFILPASQIKPTVVETWAAIKYMGKKIIEENPGFYSATVPQDLTQKELDVLKAIESFSLKSRPDLPGATTSPVNPFDGFAVNLFSGIPGHAGIANPYIYPLAPLFGVPNLGFEFGSFDPRPVNSANSENFGLFDPEGYYDGSEFLNAHFNQALNFGFPGVGYQSQAHRAPPYQNSQSFQLPDTQFFSGGPSPRPQSFRSPVSGDQPSINQAQDYFHQPNKYKDSLPQQPGFVHSSQPTQFNYQNPSIFNLPFPALLPGPAFLPGILTSSQFGGDPIQYNSPMIIKPSFPDNEVQPAQGFLGYQFKDNEQGFNQPAHFSTKSQPTPFIPSPTFSSQPFRPIIQSHASSPAKAQFKTNINAATAPEVPSAEPKFSHPFLNSPNVLVSLGSPQNDHYSFRYDGPQDYPGDGKFIPIEFSRSLSQ